MYISGANSDQFSPQQYSCAFCAPSKCIITKAKGYVNVGKNIGDGNTESVIYFLPMGNSKLIVTYLDKKTKGSPPPSNVPIFSCSNPG